MFYLKDIKYKNVLDIAELAIPPKVVTCIVGQSGSGKTTLLRLLNNLISPDKGEIFYNNNPLNTIDSTNLRREVVMLSQSPGIFQGSIKDNLLIGLTFSEKPPVEDLKLTNMLNMLKLNKDLDEDAEKLSGGEKQRLALGRILLMEPAVLLLDEPSSALDEDTENIIIESIITYVKSSNKTLIMITHSSKVAETYGDNIVKIHSGSILK